MRELSRSETVVLDLRAQGHSVKEIAEIHGVAESTVKTWLQKAYRKLGATNALGAVWRALELGIIEPPERRE